MSRRCTPNWIDTYLRYSDAQQAPKVYHLWIAISTIASALGRDTYLDRVYFKTFPNLYIGIVGPTGITKTSAGDIGVDILQAATEIEPFTEVMKEKLTSWYLYDWFKELTDLKGQCICTIYAPEMKNFLGDLNKSEMVALLTSFYGCPDSPTYRTKANKGFKFKNICLNLLACSTPEWLTTGTTVDEISGGFTGRFIYVYADKDERSVAFPEDMVTSQTHQLRADLIHDLVEIGSLKGTFIITDQAKAEYIVWYNQRKAEWNDERMRGYFARKAETVLKLAMILSASRDNSLIIDEKVLNLSWQLLNSVEQNMTGAFSGIVDDPAMRYRDHVLRTIQKSSGCQQYRSAILRQHWTRLDSVVLDRIITSLEQSNIITAHITTNHLTKKPDIMYTICDDTYRPLPT
jgi:hypothetical protein